MDKLRELLPANRLAALTGIILSVVAFLVSINESLVPGSPGAEAIGKAIVMLGSVLSVLAIVRKFMEGSQNYDSLVIAGTPKVAGATATTVEPSGAPQGEVVLDSHPPVRLADEQRDLHDTPGTGL